MTASTASVMQKSLAQLMQELVNGPAVLVRVASTEGSVPRNTGTWMAVFAQQVVGTIGGGHVELASTAHARLLLQTWGSSHAVFSAGEVPALSDGATNNNNNNNNSVNVHGAVLPVTHNKLRRYALGPALGQCCGGVMWLAFEPLPARPTLAARAGLVQRLGTPTTPVAIFGGGHVGMALAQVLARLPFAVTCIDSREAVLAAPEPTSQPQNPSQRRTADHNARQAEYQTANQAENPLDFLPPPVLYEHSQPVQAAVPCLAAGACVLVMSFSHAEDLDVVAACLQRQRERDDLRFIGLIGSRTKWAVFCRRLQARGYTPAELERVTCPIGLPGIVGKEPEVIAVSVAAQLLQMLQTRQSEPALAPALAG